jgi:hypothetical protein
MLVTVLARIRPDGPGSRPRTLADPELRDKSRRCTFLQFFRSFLAPHSKELSTMFYRQFLDACSVRHDGKYPTNLGSHQLRTFPRVVQQPKPPHPTQREIVVEFSCQSPLSVQTPSEGRVQSVESNSCRRRSPAVTPLPGKLVGGFSWTNIMSARYAQAPLLLLPPRQSSRDIPQLTG